MSLKEIILKHYEKIVNAEVPYADGAMLFDGEWYFPRFGCDTLQNLADDLAIAETKSNAFDAHAYWWPRKRSAGGGQAIGTLSCGHCGPVGAPCCQDCAKKLIEEAKSI